MSHALVPRIELLQRVRTSLQEVSVTALLGPRQCGKTELARQLGPEAELFLDLEDPEHQARMAVGAKAVLHSTRGLVVLDEIQFCPEIFPVLRVLADERDVPRRFLVLGSASPPLLQQASETLAGRIRFIEMGGLHLGEVGGHRWEQLWLRGSFPEAFLSPRAEQWQEWQRSYLLTYLSRDLPALAELRLPQLQMRRLLSFVAHCHGQTWNNHHASKSLGETNRTVKRYLDMFDGSYLIRLLPAYHVNVGKRLRTAPKVYYRDSGILHALWGVKDKAGLLGHPGLGFSWEGWAMEQVIRVMNHLPEQCFYWGTHGGAELDLLVDTGSRRIGYEFKFADAPKTTKSMRVALADLKLDRLYVVHPGSQRFPLADDAPIEALGVQSLAPPL